MQKKSILLAENLAYELSLDRTLFQKIQVSIEAGRSHCFSRSQRSRKINPIKDTCRSHRTQRRFCLV